MYTRARAAARRAASPCARSPPRWSCRAPSRPALQQRDRVTAPSAARPPGARAPRPPRPLTRQPVQLHLVLQQRVEAARRGVVRLVLQDEPAILEGLGVLMPHYGRQELKQTNVLH